MWPISALKEQYDKDFPFADTRTKNMLLVNESPVYMWILSALYVLFIWLGPKFMASRKPIEFRNTLVVYNLGLVALSAYMAVEIIASTYSAGYKLVCTPFNQETKHNPRELRVANVLWWYYFSKAIELLDTVFMILRKKNNQISFLHWFHHVTMLNIWWWTMMFIPGGLAWFGSCLNCIVHVVMYLYYGLSAIPSMRAKLWWKKHITKFQLTQFCFTLSHTLYNLFSGCDFPPWGLNLLAGYMIIMLTLFANFYVKAYSKKPNPRHSKKIPNTDYSNGLHRNGLNKELSFELHGLPTNSDGFMKVD